MESVENKYRIGVNFNPSKDPLVDEIKAAAANLIDLIETINQPPTEGKINPTWLWSHEVSRLKSLAQTSVEEAAMWAVKAATKPNIHEYVRENKSDEEGL